MELSILFHDQNIYTESLMTFLQTMPYEWYGDYEGFSNRFVTRSHPFARGWSREKERWCKVGWVGPPFIHGLIWVYGPQGQFHKVNLP